MESLFFTDDARVIADMLKNEWNLGPQNIPSIAYTVESYAQNASRGGIYVWVTGAFNKESTTDYRTLDRTVHLSIKLDNRFRDKHLMWGQEIYRILLANRRIGRRFNRGISFLRIDNHRTLPNDTGWYTSVFDVTLVSHNVPIQSAGFGDKINNHIEDMKGEKS